MLKNLRAHFLERLFLEDFLSAGQMKQTGVLSKI